MCAVPFYGDSYPNPTWALVEVFIHQQSTLHQFFPFCYNNYYFTVNKLLFAFVKVCENKFRQIEFLRNWKLVEGNPMACAPLGDPSWCFYPYPAHGWCLWEHKQEKQGWTTPTYKTLLFSPQNHSTHSIWWICEWCHREHKVPSTWPSCCSLFEIFHKMNKLYPQVSFNIIIFLSEKLLISSLIQKLCSYRGFFSLNVFEQKPLSQRKEFINLDNLTLVQRLINFYFSCSVSGNLFCRKK